MIKIKTTRDFILSTIQSGDQDKYLRTVKPYAGQVDAAIVFQAFESLKGIAPACLVGYAGIGDQSFRSNMSKMERADHLWDFFCIGKNFRSLEEAEDAAAKIFEEITDPLFNGQWHEGYGLFVLSGRNQIISVPGIVAYQVTYTLQMA